MTKPTIVAHRGASGERVSVGVREPVADRRRLRGLLTAVGPDGITVEDAEVGVTEVPFTLITEARTEFVPAPKGAPGARAPAAVARRRAAVARARPARAPGVSS